MKWKFKVQYGDQLTQYAKIPVETGQNFRIDLTAARVAMDCPFEENHQDFPVHYFVRVEDVAPDFARVCSTFEGIVAEEAEPLEH